MSCFLFAAWYQLTATSDDFLETANFDQLIETVDREIYHDPEYALKCAQTALEVAEKNESVFETATALNRVGAAHTSLGDLNSGLQYFERSLDLATEHQFDVLIARNTGNIGGRILPLGRSRLEQLRTTKERWRSTKNKMCNPACSQCLTIFRRH